MMSNFDDLLNNAPAETKSRPQLSKEEYAEKKKVEREEVFALSDQMAMEVSTDGNKFQQYLDVQAVNGRYSAVNTLLIMVKNPKASHLGSFDYWKEKNCSVKPKQTAIAILEPHEYQKEDGSPGVGYNVKKVFDISQVDTRKLRITPPQQPSERQILTALIPPKSSQYPMISGVDELPDDLGAMYNPETHTISIRKGMGFDDTFRALSQEIAFADFVTRTDAPADPAFSAYCTSYLLCKKYGADTKDFSFEGIVDVFEGKGLQEEKAQVVKGELSQIRDVVETISGRMMRQIEQAKAVKSQEAR